MQEMDGLSSSISNRDQRIVVIGATNRPFDLDDAVLRRLPRRLLVDLPGPRDRKAILEILLRNEQLAADVNLEHLARNTDGFSGSDLKHLCVAAALAAVKDHVSVPWKKESPLRSSPPSDSFSRWGKGKEENVVTEINLGIQQRQPIIHQPTACAHSPCTSTSPHASSSNASQADSTSMITVRSGAKASGGPISPDILHRNQTDEDGTSILTRQLDDGGEAGGVGSAGTAADGLGSRQTRILTGRHFETALREIRPSSSEEGTLPELRKWAEQFGEGGTKRGQKSGFGKSFGFGDHSTPVADSGYGKVVTEDFSSLLGP